MDFSIYYRKTNNGDLFKTLEKSNIRLSNTQNYVPLYKNFFSLNDSNYNSINLNHKYYLHDVKKCDTNNIIHATLCDNSDNLIEKTIFCKFSPLLDPLRYLTGKYELPPDELFKLPAHNDLSSFYKLLDVNNSAYIDGFFTYLSSQLNNHYDFIHGVDYYGCFLGNQSKFNYNIVDDISYLNDSEFFHNNKNKLFNIEGDIFSDIFNVDSRKNKKKIIINESATQIELDDINDICFDVLPVNDTEDNDDISNGNLILDLSDVCIFNHVLNKSSNSSSSSSSSYSSSSSNTNDDEDEDEDDDEDEDEDEDDSSSEDSSIEQDIFCSIYNFPVEMICLEKCENTLDMLMEEDVLNPLEWKSCLFQIIMTLTLYQKVFSLTHNDLHTNNIMYIPTDKQFIYYCYDGVYYKVPTYGRIYKIIDFGRSIYKFNGKLMCSDSFHPKGDAASQYNFEPYFDEKKPRLEPNTSFDLCRLACCLFDHFVDELSDVPKLVKTNQIVELLHQWLLDDKDRNILYKNNGDERYPEFKLYKMITRTIHNAVPRVQIQKDLFKTYVTSKKKINKNHKIMHFDKIPNLQ